MSFSFLRRVARSPAVGLLTALIISMIIAVHAYALIRSRQDVWRDIDRSADNLLHTLSASIERNLGTLELSLSGVQDALRMPELSTLSPQARDMLLFDRAASAEYLGAMLVLDPNGSVRFFSGSTDADGVDLSDRDYFIVQRDGNVPHFISRPFESRVRSGDPSIALSRRLSAPDSTFEGVALAVIRLAYFRALFGKVELNPGDVVALVRTDGTVLFRSPSTDGNGNVGTDLSKSPVFNRILAHPDDTFINTSRIDGEKRYYVSRRLGAYPLTLTVAISVNQALQRWFIQAAILCALTLVTCGLLLYVIVSLRRALLRSHEMEDQLSAMALTDALTGLPNRRGFDMAADTELRRAARDRKVLSLLMVDVDHFKRVNDTHGHPFGDQMLAQIAAQIQRSIRRPGDFAARFGGEEFVVLLPATDGSGALHIAEQIRAAITTIRLYADGACVTVTVSIGVATGLIRPGRSIGDVLDVADAALYEAKGTGRNRVVLRDIEAPPKSCPVPEIPVSGAL